MSEHDRLAWWRAARFGMIIHWGLYALPAGEWKGQQMEYIGEWLQSRFRIPGAEYSTLAERFNPQGFDADEWVRLAARAGMRYIIFTAKHHEGFAMYHSRVSDFNIVDATPFGRDPAAELAEACARYGVKLCFYYSQDLDWHEADGGGTAPGLSSNFGMSWGNDWDFPDHDAKDFSRFFEGKVKPQVTELLTQYGPIGALWFDCPMTLSHAQSEELYALARSLQPDCVMNSRLGNGLGDYQSLGDNLIPAAPLAGDWEVVATLNDTWGYKRNDINWKTSRQVLELLTGLAGKGVNYALNVGPDELGRFPEGTVRVLEELGEWMDTNAEAIHDTEATPWPHDLPTGPVTRAPKRLYLHLHNWPEKELSLVGLSTPVKSAQLLGQPDQPLQVEQNPAEGWQPPRIRIDLPVLAPKGELPVVRLDLSDEAEVEPGLLQQADGSLYLPATSADTTLARSPLGTVEGWHTPEGELVWYFRVHQPGSFEVRLLTSALWHSAPWEGGHLVQLEVAGQRLTARLEADEVIENAATSCYALAASSCGRLNLPEAGEYELRLTALEVAPTTAGLALMAAQLLPVKEDAQ